MWVKYCFFYFLLVLASIGDNLALYQNYYRSCLRKHCSNKNAIQHFYTSQPLYMQLFGWDCIEECKYQSQWLTISELKAQQVVKIPQFYGKWTFYRFYGIQEPASFIFSICNFVTNLVGWRCYKQVNGRDPLHIIWKLQVLINLHAWFWSTIYHGHETRFTEKMDYFSAFLVVIFSLYAISVKSLKDIVNLKFKSLYAYLTVGMPFLAFYLYHIHYLNYVYFDYGFNMKVNVVTGLLSTCLWMCWCYVYRRKRVHVWKCAVSLFSVNLCLLLELFDFAPIGYVFDAHSLWHLFTIPLPLLWFNFLKDETQYLIKYERLPHELEDDNQDKVA